MKRLRNWWVETLRFYAAISIVLYHFGGIYPSIWQYFPHSYIWVEFFFCLSGYYLAKKLSMTPSQETISPVRYAFSEAKKLYPFYITAFLLCLVVTCVENHLFSLTYMIDLLWNSKWEILFLTSNGITSNTLNAGGAPDYISSMLLASLLLCWLIGDHRKIFANVLGPFTVIICYARILNLAGNISQWRAFDGYVSLGLMRAMAGMSMGALTALWLPAILEKSWHKTKGLVFIVAFLGFTGVMLIGLVAFRDIISFSDLVLYVPLFAILLAICDTAPMGSSTCRVAQLGRWAGKLSYPMFVFHWPVLRMFSVHKNLFQEFNDSTVACLFCLSVLLVSVMALLLKGTAARWQR